VLGFAENAVFFQTPEDLSLKIHLLYFAALRDLAGKSQETIDVTADVRTVAALRAHLEREVPSLGGRLDAVRWAQNEVFVGMETAIADGDTIALIPPVAGG
jgi:molybdopterin converting factor subunit 1